VVGVAGIGKSRLAWEFEKYIDGVAQLSWWHRGRCLSYGEGVAYWALAEMVRMRARIAEDEEPASAMEKLRTAIETHIVDADERRWAEPRLAHLLGLEEFPASDRETLFSAWRLFFERMAERNPTIMVFEDIQWADAALLDFIEYLLEWSRDHPLFILTLARPDLIDRRPTWGAGRRNFTSIFLEPLQSEAMDELLRGPVPGLPDELRTKILERAEGVPFYAVETVRMLLDRGLLVREGDRFVLRGHIESLEVPETLHTLIAARLDGLAQPERRLLQDAAVLGKSFTRAALGTLTALPEAEVDQGLASLVRKEFLFPQSDPRSPEHGQYSFVQDLVKKVAYDTLSKKERKARHQAVAAYLQSTFGPEESEYTEVVASHFLEAYRLAPGAPDAAEMKSRAREALTRAGQRAASLAANDQAQHYYEQAAELADDPLEQAALHERAGMMAYAVGRMDEAEELFTKAIGLFESRGQTHPAARVSARLSNTLWRQARLEEAVARMETAFRTLSEEERDADLGSLAAESGRVLFFSGQTEAALARVEVALQIAEALWLPEVLSEAVNTKGIILSAVGRRKEGLSLVKLALETALESDAPWAALRAYFNLSDLCCHLDRYQEANEYLSQGLALARRLGTKLWEGMFMNQMYPPLALGDWDAALARS
jgi:predicted ATPase